MKAILFFYLLVIYTSCTVLAQKDSLKLGDTYAEDQIYVSISYAQFYNQPSTISKSNFSYALSVGFIKDFTLNKTGSFSVAAGIGYGYDFFNHELKLDEINNSTFFSVEASINSNLFKSYLIEFPFEIRWRTSTAKKYNFWRIYSGIKFLYNVSNSFEYIDANNNQFNYSNVSKFRKLQYGLTFSAGYDILNVYLFYGLTPIFENATLNSEAINTKIFKFGLIFYIL